MDAELDKINISILMPAKNAAEYLRPCIDSIRLQTHSNWELIIVDDFSTDETAQIISDYTFEDQRIIGLKNIKSGIIPALALAYENSTGTYITRMDADDIMPNNKLELFFGEILKCTKKTIVTGRVAYFSNCIVSPGYQRYQNWLNNLSSLENSFSEIYRECIVASPNWLVHKSCFESDFLLSDLNYPEDYDMVFHWYKSGYKIKWVNSVTHLWREHEARTSRTSLVYQQKSFFTLKTNYFIDIELVAGEKIQLIGAGKKGKIVAEILKFREVDFDWFDFKATEENFSILPVSKISKNYKSILTVWPESLTTQQEIKEYLEKIGLKFGENVWVF